MSGEASAEMGQVHRPIELKVLWASHRELVRDILKGKPTVGIIVTAALHEHAAEEARAAADRYW